jgi:peptidoglycan hydrolase-like protein with peptidoglycan-binding domain
MQLSQCYERKINIDLGDSGSCVSFVQEALILLGNTELGVTGFYDDETKVLLAGFQKAHNVDVKNFGQVDFETMTVLSQAVSPKSHSSPYAPANGTLLNIR